ncbi:CPBP family intramembrane glutamic endopeptidase [Brevibacillus sp. SYSU BS000544]|uniref:CPBP family intramembrane glutamic endopeptidase n=1 Tax=Brevibacillus sp. SYSU BS000544 TaxID=3416443 RepID=UPI003CE59CAE
MDWLTFLLMMGMVLPGILFMAWRESKIVKLLKPEEEEIPFSVSFITHLIMVTPFALAGAWTYDDAGFKKPSFSEVNSTVLLIGFVCALIHLLYYYGYIVKHTEKDTIKRIDTVRKELGIMPRIFYGGVVEEVIFRWGVVSILVWATSFLIGRIDLTYWIAILISSLLFALFHLPGAYQIVDKLTPVLRTYVIFANMFVGICCGWLFWKYGLLAAISCHMLFHFIWYLYEKVSSKT